MLLFPTTFSMFSSVSWIISKIKFGLNSYLNNLNVVNETSSAAVIWVNVIHDWGDIFIISATTQQYLKSGSCNQDSLVFLSKDAYFCTTSWRIFYIWSYFIQITLVNAALSSELNIELN